MKQIFTREFWKNWPPPHLLGRRGFDLDPSCKLWLPFYKYGSEQSKIWDQSGNNNHGTITGAVPYPGNPQYTSVGSTYNRGDFTSTNAFFWSSIDVSAYAGTDVGSTPYWIRVVDGAGKVASGYLAGVGADTLGSELLTVWSNASYNTFTSVGKDITSAIDLGGTCIASSNLTTFMNGQLLKFISTLTPISGQLPGIFYNGTAYLLDGELSAGLNTIYHNTLSATDSAYRFFNTLAANWSAVNSSKRVTDCPATACHVVSSLNGTTRAWESIESGFNPNTIASWRIDSVIPSQAIGWYFDGVNDYIECSGPDFTTEDITLFIWAKLNPTTEDDMRLFSKRGTAGYELIVESDGVDIVRFLSDGASSVGDSSTSTINLINSGYHLIGVVYDRTNGVSRAYVDATQMGSDVDISSVTGSTAEVNPLKIGKYTSNIRYINGNVGEALIFNRALSAVEIRNYYELTRHIYGV